MMFVVLKCEVDDTKSGETKIDVWCMEAATMSNPR